jgi:hypothetical protein
MTYWKHESAEGDERLLELATLFVESRDAFFRSVDEFGWIPAANSSASHAADHLRSPDPRVDQPVGESGHRLIAEVVQLHLLTAGGHLGGLGSLFASGEVAFSPPALIRSTIENCARAMWVLGEGPAEPVENRLARAYLEEALSAHEAKVNAGLMHRDGRSHLAAKKHYKALRIEILQRFPGTDIETLDNRRALVGQQWLGLEDTVKWMYTVFERMGAPISNREGQGVYGYLSNMTHPTLYPVRDKLAWRDDPESGRRVPYLRRDVAVLESHARAALTTFYNALAYVTDYFGWPNDVLDDLEVAITKTMPTFFLPT